ncbi:response regulator [Candidatus Kaiserbacteria bacterium]|nr:response regulator [Candidatus Kaiserbacteria bacterium]
MINDTNYNAVDILLVEDNQNDSELTLRALRKHNLANHIHTVEDGEAALEFIFCTGRYASRDIVIPPKVILLDLKLPKVNGLEVLKKIKSDERTKSIPVVILTSSAETSDLESAYLLGVNSYLVKPVDFEKFIRVLGDAGLYWLLINRSLRL